MSNFGIDYSKMGGLNGAFPVALRLAGIKPEDVAGIINHGKKEFRDRDHIDLSRTILNTEWSKFENIDEHIKKRAAEMSINNFDSAVSGLKAMGRKSDAFNAQIAGMQNPWNGSTDAPMREGILTVHRDYFAAPADAAEGSYIEFYNENGEIVRQCKNKLNEFKVVGEKFLRETFGDMLVYTRFDLDEQSGHFHFILYDEVKKEPTVRFSKGRELISVSHHPLIKSENAAPGLKAMRAILMRETPEATAALSEMGISLRSEIKVARKSERSRRTQKVGKVKSDGTLIKLFREAAVADISRYNRCMKQIFGSDWPEVLAALRASAGQKKGYERLQDAAGEWFQRDEFAHMNIQRGEARAAAKREQRAAVDRAKIALKKEGIEIPKMSPAASVFYIRNLAEQRKDAAGRETGDGVMRAVVKTLEELKILDNVYHEKLKRAELKNLLARFEGIAGDHNQIKKDPQLAIEKIVRELAVQAEADRMLAVTAAQSAAADRAVAEKMEAAAKIHAEKIISAAKAEAVRIAEVVRSELNSDREKLDAQKAALDAREAALAAREAEIIQNGKLAAELAAQTIVARQRADVLYQRRTENLDKIIEKYSELTNTSAEKLVDVQAAKFITTTDDGVYIRAGASDELVTHVFTRFSDDKLKSIEFSMRNHRELDLETGKEIAVEDAEFKRGFVALKREMERRFVKAIPEITPAPARDDIKSQAQRTIGQRTRG